MIFKGDAGVEQALVRGRGTDLKNEGASKTCGLHAGLAGVGVADEAWSVVGVLSFLIGTTIVEASLHLPGSTAAVAACWHWCVLMMRQGVMLLAAWRDQDGAAALLAGVLLLSIVCHVEPFSDCRRKQLQLQHVAALSKAGSQTLP